MSAGSGKVYFVLYLAVVLELLIIIVDRDEAEEGMRKQNKEIQLIVQRILASLQTSGSQISTTPRDEITLDPTSTNKKNEERTYQVTVAVGDTTSLRGLSGFEINRLMYTLSYDRDTAAAAKQDTGNFPQIVPVGLNGANYSEPVNIVKDSVLYPVMRDLTRHRQTFQVHFKPDQPGVYRLRFNSNINQIIGVEMPEHEDIKDPERLKEIVRIGNVPLTVKQLIAVKKTLEVGSNVGQPDTTIQKLKAFVENLLYGRSSSLESNNGEIKFDVVVRKLDVPPSAKLEIPPQVRRFTAFAGIPIPNLIKANVKQIKFDPPQFGEFYQTADSTWYWRWQPSDADVGKTFTMTYSAHASRNAGALDNATDTLQVTVQKRAFTDKVWFKPNYYAANNIIPIGDSVTMGRYYKEVEGTYRYELQVGGKVLGEATGQMLAFALPEDKMGQAARLVMSFKTKEMADFVRLDSVNMQVGPRAIFTTVPNSTLTAGTPLSINVLQGINPQIPLPAGTVVTIEDDQGGRFFKREFTMTGSPSLTVPMTPGANVSTSQPINIKIRSNTANQLEDEQSLTINPKPRKR